jgi:hypothetical protein
MLSHVDPSFFGISVFVYQADIQHAMSLRSSVFLDPLIPLDFAHHFLYYLHYLSCLFCFFLENSHRKTDFAGLTA